MTIDLGFAWTELAGRAVAFVDVPGHERFVTTMLAGVGPVPAVLLVVAADEGWMPQSAEHVAALSALGVRDGLLVLTRSDLMDPELARADAREHLAGTPLADLPDVAVSARTGAGLDALRAAIGALAAGCPSPTPPRTCGCGSTAPSRCAARAPSSPAPCGGPRPRRGRAGAGRPAGRRPRAAEPRGPGAGGHRHGPRRAQPARRAPRFRRPRRGAADARGLAGRRPARRPPARRPPARRPPARRGRSRPARRADAARRLRGRGRPGAPARAGRGAAADRPAAAAADRRPRGAARPGQPARPGGDRARRGAAPAAPPRCGRRARRRAGRATRPAAGRRRGRPPGPGARGRPARHGRPRGAAVGHRLAALPRPRPHGRRGARRRGRRHDAADPLHPGLPTEAARRAAGLPDARLLDAVLGPAGLRHGGGRVERDASGGRTGPRTCPGASAARWRPSPPTWSTDPFAAPDAERLAALGLGPRELASLVRAGALLRVADGVVLLPGPRTAPWPCSPGSAGSSPSAPRGRPWGTSRRVAVPLLELLARTGRTARTPDGNHRLRAPAGTPPP
jgi:selenocysteine-specific elongation factor